MKVSLWIKFGLVLPLLLLADYIIMVLLGCASCLFGVGDDYYCGGYCLVGKLILIFSAAFFIFLILPDLKKLLKRKDNPENFA